MFTDSYYSRVILLCNDRESGGEGGREKERDGRNDRESGGKERKQGLIIVDIKTWS